MVKKSVLMVTAEKIVKRVIVNHLRSIQCPFLADLYDQDAVSEGGVARRSIESSITDAEFESLIAEAKRMNYPAFIMGDQIVVFFTEDAVVKQLSGPSVTRVGST